MAQTVRDVVSRLRSDGFTVDRTRGSHQMYAHPDGRRVSVQVNHRNRQLPAGTLRKIYRDAGWEWTPRPPTATELRIIRTATEPGGKVFVSQLAQQFGLGAA